MPAHPGSEGSGKDRAALNCCPLWAESGMGNLPQHGRACDGFHWFLLWCLISSQVLVNYWTFLCWLLNRERALHVQLHHSLELKWSKARQKTSCDWGFKVVHGDQSLKDTQVFFSQFSAHFLSHSPVLLSTVNSTSHNYLVMWWISPKDGEECWPCSCILLFFLPPTVLFIPTDRNFISIFMDYMLINVNFPSARKITFSQEREFAISQ